MGGYLHIYFFNIWVKEAASNSRFVSANTPAEVQQPLQPTCRLDLAVRCVSPPGGRSPPCSAPPLHCSPLFLREGEHRGLNITFTISERRNYFSWASDSGWLQEKQRSRLWPTAQCSVFFSFNKYDVTESLRRVLPEESECSTGKWNWKISSCYLFLEE